MRAIVERILAGLLLVAGAVRFVEAGFLPATRRLTGDFGAVFPTAYLARLRPDFPTESVWPGWNYGPMLHFITMPLFLLPRWSMIPSVWAVVNLCAVAASFVLVCRLSGVRHRVTSTVVVVLAAFWLSFQPLGNCFSQGNIEILEMMLVLWGVAALPRRERRAGVAIGVATMLKFLPVGFLGWFLVRRRWRAALFGVATIAAIATLTTFTLGWKDSVTFGSVGWAATEPVAGMHELSVTSLFLHRTSVLNAETHTFDWLSSARSTAAQAGAVASVLFAAGFALLFLLRRSEPALEVSVLFMTMFMVLPWNHDYYYVFALVPLSILFLRAVAERKWTLLTLVVASYLMMSPPIPFGWVDRAHVFSMPFVYILNYYDVPVLGGLLLWLTATHEMLVSPGEAAVRDWRRFGRGGALLLAIPALIVAVCAGAWFATAGRRGDPVPQVLAVQPAVLLSASRALAISPDGSRLAYIAGGRSDGVLCVRVGDGPASCWHDAGPAADPFFSADGRWIGFFAGDELRKVPVGGGAFEVISTGVHGGRTASWAPDGTILLATGEGIVRIPASGREPKVVIPAAPLDGPYASPAMLPSGEVVLFTTLPPGGGPGTIVAQSLETGQRTPLISGSQPYFDARRGQLVYSRGGRVLAAELNLETLVVSGVSVPLATNVLLTPGGAQFAVSANDTVIYVPGSPLPAVQRTLMWVDRKGTASALAVSPAAFETPRLSGDGRTVAVTIRDLTTDVWSYDVERGRPTRLTAAGNNETPVWTPDGQGVSFVSRPADSPLTIVSAQVDGLFRAPARLWGANEVVLANTWFGPSASGICCAHGSQGQAVQLGGRSPDGRMLVGVQGGRVWLLDLRVTPSVAWRIDIGPQPSSAAARQAHPVFSPDGRWLAYTSTESGRSEVYLQSIPDMKERRQVSVDGGTEPVFSHDGRELFFRDREQMMVAGVMGRPMLVLSAPRALFRDIYARSAGDTANYDVTADAQRLLMIKAERPSVSSEVRVVRRWSALVNR